MTIETPTAHLSLMTEPTRVSESVRRCEVTPCGDGTDPDGEGVAVQMELGPAPGHLATLMLSSSEAELMAHALLRAIDQGRR